ncbi:unnamed protein product, partial [Arabidopsis halleri]
HDGDAAAVCGRRFEAEERLCVGQREGSGVTWFLLTVKKRGSYDSPGEREQWKPLMKDVQFIWYMCTYIINVLYMCLYLYKY